MQLSVATQLPCSPRTCSSYAQRHCQVGWWSADCGRVMRGIVFVGQQLARRLCCDKLFLWALAFWWMAGGEQIVWDGCGCVRMRYCLSRFCSACGAASGHATGCCCWQCNAHLAEPHQLQEGIAGGVRGVWCRMLQYCKIVATCSAVLCVGTLLW